METFCQAERSQRASAPLSVLDRSRIFERLLKINVQILLPAKRKCLTYENRGSGCGFFSQSCTVDARQADDGAKVNYYRLFAL